MKKILLILFALLFSSTLIIPRGFSDSTNPNINLAGTYWLDVYEDQKMQGEKMIASLLITNMNGHFQISWSHIYITPHHKEKDVGLKTERFSSGEGTIKNFQLHNDHTITFQISPGPDLWHPSFDLDINVLLRLSENDQRIEDVNAHMIFWSTALNEKVMREWKRAKDSFFELPYRKVF